MRKVLSTPGAPPEGGTEPEAPTGYYIPRFQEPSLPINIDQLNEPELVDLNHRIVARLKFPQHERAHSAMLEFSLGQRVAFEPPVEVLNCC
jgi:hypothetical protein